MRVASAQQIPHRRLRPFLKYWEAQRGGRPRPERDDIALDVLRGAAANAAFCRIDDPYVDLDSIRLVNVGSAIERATGNHLTGLTVGQLLRAFGSSAEFTYCFSEYGQAATEGCCTYNEGVFPWQEHAWLAYRRLVMPLGAGARPDGLFVMIDLNAVGLGLVLPETLSHFDGADDAPSRPWAMPPLRIGPGDDRALRA